MINDHTSLFHKPLPLFCGYIFAFLMGSVVLGGSAWADDAQTIGKKLGLSLYGYVDASYTYNFNRPKNNINQLRIFDTDSNSFRPNLAQIVLEKEGKTGGTLRDRAGFRIKLNFGEDAEFTGGDGDDVDFQEAYAQFIVPVGNGIDLRIGRMNTLIGYEVIESPYNPNFSRSWLFGLGQPFTTTGIRLGYDFNDYVGFSVGVINSFTGLTRDSNDSKSVEAAVFLNPHDRVGLTLYGFWGKERPAAAATSGERVLAGGILDLQVLDNLQFLLEGYYANQAKAGVPTPAGNARWNGIAGYLIYDLNERWGARIRGEIFEDGDGASGFNSCLPVSASLAGTCFGGATPAQTLWETTVTLQYKPVPDLITRLEFRYDKSNKPVFQDEGKADSDQETLALEAIYLF